MNRLFVWRAWHEYKIAKKSCCFIHTALKKCISITPWLNDVIYLRSWSLRTQMQDSQAEADLNWKVILYCNWSNINPKRRQNWVENPESQKSRKLSRETDRQLHSTAWQGTSERHCYLYKDYWGDWKHLGNKKKVTAVKTKTLGTE